METDVYVVDSRELKPWYELLPNKIKKVLENPGPHDRLLVCVEKDIWGEADGERMFFNDIRGVEYTSSRDFNPKDYDELSIRGPEKFFETHALSVHCYDIPDIAIAKSATFAFYNKVAKALATLQVTKRHFLVCVSQEFGAHVMFLTNCSVVEPTLNKTASKTTAQPTSQPKPLEWLSAEQCEVLSLRLELLRRDYEEWCDVECLSYERELFGNSEKFITACHDGTLLDSVSNPSEYKVLQSWYQNILSLQGLGHLCGHSGKAAKILHMLKPYLDAVYDLPLPVKEDSGNE